MNMIESKSYCIELVMDFIKEYCDEDIEQLCSVDIEKIEENSKYGKPNDYKSDKQMDPDDSMIARAVLYLLYSDEIADLSYDDMGSKYRGDTIFTPGNLMGKSKDLLMKNDFTFWKNLKNEVTPKEEFTLDVKIREFLSKYHTFPNMILLPNYKVEVRRKGQNGCDDCRLESLNNYRGMNNPGFSDYIDLFLLEIKEFIENGTTSDPDFMKLCEKNSFYLDEYRGKFNRFIHSHFLEIIFNNNEMREEFKFKHYVRWKKSDHYADEITKFIDAFDELWNFRKEKILERIKAVLLWGSLTWKISYKKLTEEFSFMRKQESLDE